MFGGVTKSFTWVGNHPGVDLCNTTPLIDGHEVDLLESPRDLAEWCAQAGIGAPRPSAADLAWVHDLRGYLRPILDPTRTGEAGAARRELNSLLAATPVHYVARDGGITLVAHRDSDEFRATLAAAVLPALGLDRGRLRRCANPACVLLFYDTSKSGSRRWCDMATCGNRAKAAMHYRRLTGS